MNKLAIAFACAVVFTLPAQAQSPGAPVPDQDGVVTLVRITGDLSPVRQGEPPLPFDVLTRLEQDPFLSELRTEPQAETRPKLLLSYRFPSVEAYRAWAGAPQTRQLFDLLRQRAEPFDLSVSLVRSPGATPSSRN